MTDGPSDGTFDGKSKMPSVPPNHGVCPKCGGQTNVLLFMGVQPDGYICPKCKLWIASDGMPLAVVIS